MPGDEFHAADGFPPTLRFSFSKIMDLRYGENPHQKAAMYTNGSGVGVANAHQVQGKELSYNNIVDLQAAWDLAQEFDETVCALSSTRTHRYGTGKTLQKLTSGHWSAIRFLRWWCNWGESCN